MIYFCDLWEARHREGIGSRSALTAEEISKRIDTTKKGAQIIPLKRDEFFPGHVKGNFHKEDFHVVHDRGEFQLALYTASVLEEDVYSSVEVQETSILVYDRDTFLNDPDPDILGKEKEFLRSDESLSHVAICLVGPNGCNSHRLASNLSKWSGAISQEIDKLSEFSTVDKMVRIAEVKEILQRHGEAALSEDEWILVAR
jgi:hypothetical protein